MSTSLLNNGTANDSNLEFHNETVVEVNVTKDERCIVFKTEHFDFVALYITAYAEDKTTTDEQALNRAVEIIRANNNGSTDVEQLIGKKINMYVNKRTKKCYVCKPGKMFSEEARESVLTKLKSL